MVDQIFKEDLNLKRRDVKITKTLNQAYETHISSLKLHNKIPVSCIYEKIIYSVLRLKSRKIENLEGSKSGPEKRNSFSKRQTYQLVLAFHLTLLSPLPQKTIPDFHCKSDNLWFSQFRKLQ